MKKRITYLLFLAISALCCISCGKKNENIYFQDSTDNKGIEEGKSTSLSDTEKDDILALKVGSDNVGYVTLPYMKAEYFDEDNDGLMDLGYYKKGLSQDSLYGQSSITYDGKGYGCDTIINLVCVGSKEYVEDILGDQDVTEISDIISVISDYAGGIECPDFSDDEEIHIAEDHDGNIRISSSYYQDSTGSTKYIEAKFFSVEEIYYYSAISGWDSNKLSIWGDSVTQAALSDILDSWKPSDRDKHVGILGTYGFGDYELDIDGLTPDGTYALTNYDTMGFYLTNIEDLGIDNEQQLCHGLCQREFDLDEKGAVTCTLRQSVDFNGLSEEAESYLTDSMLIKDCKMGSCTLNLYDIGNDMWIGYASYDNSDFMVKFSTFDGSFDMSAIKKFLKKLNIQKVVEL